MTSLRAIAGCLLLIAAPFVLLVMYLGSTGVSVDGNYSRWNWSNAKESVRVSMARDYLATHAVPGMSRADVLVDLGTPLWDFECWTYAVSENGLGDGYGWPPSHQYEPTVHVSFDPVTGRVERVFGSYIAPGEALAFDAATWRESAHFPHLRGQLANGLVHDQGLVTRTRDEILAELGEPDIAERAMYYQIGRDNSGHERCLELWFDAEWRVTHAVIEDENG